VDGMIVYDLMRQTKVKEFLIWKKLL